MAEFQIKTTQENGSITFNYEEMMAYIESETTPYKGMVVTEDSIKSGKEIAARFNNLAKDLNKCRIEAQKVYMKPFDAFKAQIDEAIQKLNESRDEIKTQLDAFEQKRIEERRAELEKIYSENIGDLKEYIPFKMVFKDKWLLKGTKAQDVIYDIQEQMVKVQTEISAIKALNSEIEEECLKAYKAAGNSLPDAIKRNTDYLDAKRKAEEAFREEQDRKAKEEAEKSNDEPKEEPKEESEGTPKDDFINPPESAYMIKVFSEDALEDIKRFCNFNEIEYEVM